MTRPRHASRRVTRALTSIWLWPAVGIIAAAVGGWVFDRTVAIAIGACVVALVAGVAVGLSAAALPTRESGWPTAPQTSSIPGRHTSLQGANLRNAILTRADLRHADLRGAELAGADLEGADLRDANLAPLSSLSEFDRR